MRTNKIMKKVLLTLFCAVTAIYSASAAPNATQPNLNKGETAMTKTSVKDYEAVKAVLNKYLDAGREGKSDILRPYVHKDALMFGRAGGKLEGGSIDNLFAYLDSHPAAKELEAEITEIDIVEGIAHAKVESDNWNGARFTDMFLLVKDGNDWKILTKTFYAH